MSNVFLQTLCFSVINHAQPIQCSADTLKCLRPCTANAMQMHPTRQITQQRRFFSLHSIYELLYLIIGADIERRRNLTIQRMRDHDIQHFSAIIDNRFQLPLRLFGRMDTGKCISVSYTHLMRI